MKCKHCSKEIDFVGSCDECIKKWEEANKKEEINNQIREIIPKKFWDIKTDRDIDIYSGKNLFIYGSVGSGKTVMMASIAKGLIKDNKYVKWINYPELAARLKGSFRSDNHEEDVYTIARGIAEWRGWLCIDDMRAESETGIVKEATYYIINHREIEVLPTIITSNIGLSEWEQRIASRISGMMEVVKLQGKDRRL